MFSLIQLTDSKPGRQWILMDVETGLPLFYPLRYLVDHLAFRSLSTQSASLQAIKFFYEFWYQKYGVTFCYSFYQSEHNPLIAIQEISAFFHYLESGHVYQANVMLLASHSTASRLTNAERVRAVIRFLSFLVNTYVSPMYMKGSPEELSRLSLQLNTKLMICRDEFSVLARGKRAKNSDSHQGFRSLTGGIVRAVYEIIAPNTGSKTNPLNPFPAGEIQFRNFLIVRLLLNYGLRISELLLLECRSIKPNIQGDKYSLIVTTIDDEVKDSRGRAPSLKNIYAHRVLELANQDYFFLMTYIEKIRSPMTPYHFIFTSTTRKHAPLSYNAVYAIFSKIDAVFTREHPEYKAPDRFDSISKLTPHITRHTWAYLTLQRTYILRYHKIKRAAQIAGLDFSISGLMDEAKDALRLIGGWSHTSHMPDVYAKRFLSERANAANLHRITHS